MYDGVTPYFEASSETDAPRLRSHLIAFWKASSSLPVRRVRVAGAAAFAGLPLSLLGLVRRSPSR
mgnify:CR=1 FL=1